MVFSSCVKMPLWSFGSRETKETVTRLQTHCRAGPRKQSPVLRLAELALGPPTGDTAPAPAAPSQDATKPFSQGSFAGAGPVLTAGPGLPPSPLAPSSPASPCSDVRDLEQAHHHHVLRAQALCRYFKHPLPHTTFSWPRHVPRQHPGTAWE